MKKILIVSLVFVNQFGFGQNLKTKFEETNGTKSPGYFEIIDWWQKLAKQSSYVEIRSMGMTDAGYPLHLVVVSGDKDFDFQSLRRKNKRIILINNGIHPGEPDGIDASMLLVRDFAIHKCALPSNIVLAIIPVYNIGGCLNRSANYRIDQNGPLEKGFRGNSQNLDLNRDFIKCDSKEARAFTEIFHLLDPDVFVDNHVSDGADYQHVMTLVTSQHNKLGGTMGEFLEKEFDPGLYQLMRQHGYDLVPYVNSFTDTPESGWPEFWDSPRFSSGFAALWNTFGFIPETHMLKPYDQRVRATYALMQSFIEFTSKNSDTIRRLREQAKQSVKGQEEFPIGWQLDRSKWKEIIYKGYAAEHKPSEVSGLPRLYYDRSKPFEKQVKFFNYYKVTASIKKPEAYIIPRGWWKVAELLQLNKVSMQPLQKDTSLFVEIYHIDNYKTSAREYEMHHMNSQVKVSVSRELIVFHKGDWYIPMNQAANRFIIETLEPQGEDSYFAWNFFESILGQKEGYSDYAFEDIAAVYLKDHPDVRAKLEERREADSSFAKSADLQLDFVYQHSPYFESEYLQYPVYRVVN